MALSFENSCQASSSSFMSGQAGTIRKGRGKVCTSSSLFFFAGTIRKGRCNLCTFPRVVSSGFVIPKANIRGAWQRVYIPEGRDNVCTLTKVVSIVALFKKPMFVAPAARNNRYVFLVPPWQQWLETSPLLPGGGLIQARARVGASGNIDEAHILKSVANVLLTSEKVLLTCC